MNATDIVIIGAGAAGMPAAIMAGQAGATVTLIDKNEEIGGTLRFAQGQISAGGARVQQRKGIVDSPEHHVDDLLRFGWGHNDPALVRLAAREATAMVDWLEELGVEWDPEAPQIMPAQEPYAIPRTYWAANDGAGRAFFEILKPVLESLRDAGTVTIRTSTRVVALRPAASGWSVASDGPTGSETFVARAVILTTGGYASNREMWERLHPEYARALSRAQPFTVGDGHQLVEPLGVPITGTGAWAPSIGAVEDPDRPGFALRPGPSAMLNLRSRRPPEIWVNALGERFTREDHPDKRTRELPVLDQPELRFWIIWDDRMLDERPRLIPGWTPDRVRSEAQSSRVIWSADTIEALAERAGLPAAALAATIAEYNDAVRNGQDPRLGREYLPLPISEPPFYAMCCAPGSTTSYAGIAVNDRLEVLDGKGVPLPGLFAAGEVIGVGKLMGRSHASGMALGPALALGRWLGREVAERLRESDRSDQSDRSVRLPHAWEHRLHQVPDVALGEGAIDSR